MLGFDETVEKIDRLTILDLVAAVSLWSLVFVDLSSCACKSIAWPANR